MKILSDVNMAHPLRGEFPGPEIATAQSKGWVELDNGELVAAAEASGFEIFITADTKSALPAKFDRKRDCHPGFANQQAEDFAKYCSHNSHEIEFRKPGRFL